jgi:hypothetical protein
MQQKYKTISAQDGTISRHLAELCRAFLAVRVLVGVKLEGKLLVSCLHLSSSKQSL